jgi:hypothetical protein
MAHSITWVGTEGGVEGCNAKRSGSVTRET